MDRRLFVLARIATTLAATALFAPASLAVTVWTDWTSATVGDAGAATGTLNGVGVTYSGEIDGAVTTNPTSSIWAPNSSFIGGTSTTSPSTVGDDIRLNGSSTGVNTITFDTPIEDPLIAIWSLGAGAAAATFTFVETPTFQAGGPNASFGGSPISVVGNVVSGNEGNGVVQFTGTFSSISWTNTFENFYAFTVGTAGTPTGVPESGTLALLGLGLLGLGLTRRKAN